MKKIVYLLAFLPFFSFSNNPTSLNDSPAFPKAPSAPAGLSNFEAISDGKKVYVNWTIANEKNFDYFTIEKSKDGIRFETSVLIKGAGISSTIIDYSEIDYNPLPGISYYRIKQTDYFGQVSYSEISTVNYLFSSNATIIPFTKKDFENSDFKEIQEREILVVLRDSKGDEFFSKVFVTPDKELIYATDKKNTLSQGTYVVMASSYNRLYCQKLIIK